MNFLYTVVLILIAFNYGQSQVAVEIQFEENEYICSYSHFEGVDLYATFNSSNNKISIYDVSHKIVKSLIYKPDEYLNSVFIYALSRDVFNSDNDLEFLIHSITGKGLSSVQLLNEQNVVIQEFEAVTFRTIGNKHYLLESDVETTTDMESREPRASRTDKLYPINGKFRKIVY